MTSGESPYWECGTALHRSIWRSARDAAMAAGLTQVTADILLRTLLDSDYPGVCIIPKEDRVDFCLPAEKRNGDLWQAEPEVSGDAEIANELAWRYAEQEGGEIQPQHFLLGAMGTNALTAAW